MPQFPYTDKLSFECPDCGFEAQESVCPGACPACGARSIALKDEMLNPLRDFVSGAMVDLQQNGIRVANIPVTQMVWRLVMGTNPSRFRGDFLPVETVSYDDCQTFVEKVNATEIFRKSGLIYRLPTSQEWSSVARRGRRKFSNLAWSWETSESTTHPVGELGANPLGLYDLFGNVWEWCSDLVEGEVICRGGCWCCDEDGCKMVERWPRDTRRSFIGLRLFAEVGR